MKRPVHVTASLPRKPKVSFKLSQTINFNKTALQIFTKQETLSQNINFLITYTVICKGDQQKSDMHFADFFYQKRRLWLHFRLERLARKCARAAAIRAIGTRKGEQDT